MNSTQSLKEPVRHNMRVAIVHDYFREFGGAERVVEEIQKLYPSAEVYTALVNPHNLRVHWARLKDWKFVVSWFGKIPLMRDYPSLFRFLTPYIWESFDFSEYDLVISSSGWFMCKGIITRPETLHISYIHHQNKFLTYYETPDDWQQSILKRFYGYLVGTPLRMWDYVGSQRPDVLIANSQETRRRIKKYYRRDAEVINPPINDPHIDIEDKLRKTQSYYINVNRLAKPKHVEVLIQTANKMGIKLYIVGKGKEYSYLSSIAKKNIIFTGEISDQELHTLMLGARAFLYAAIDEDFGMAPVEAMMYGVPVIAYRSGGLKETVEHGKNGFLVDELTAEYFSRIIQQFEKKNYSLYARTAHKSAKKYRSAVFQQSLQRVVAKNLRTS